VRSGRDGILDGRWGGPSSVEVWAYGQHLVGVMVYVNVAINLSSLSEGSYR
jgi:hypothetical protein